MTTLEKGFNSILTRKTFWDNAFVADDMFIHSILTLVLRSNSDGQTYLNAEFVCQSIFDGFRAENSDNMLNINFLCPRTLICQTSKSKRVLFQLIQLGVEQKYTRK